MLTVVVTRKYHETDAVCVIELADAQGRPLPPFSAGAHIDLHLGEQWVRQYSLCNAPSERHRYVIAVQRDSQSRGGSRWLHDHLQRGQLLTASPPRNHFTLHPSPATHVLVAAGIGITPLLSMAHALAQRGDPFELHYRTRGATRVALLAHLQEHFAGQLQLYPDRASFTRAALPGAARPDRHLYVCGPPAFMEQMLGTSRGLGWAPGNLHREYFTSAGHSHATEGAFEVQIASSGAIYPVAPHQSVYDVLAAAGVAVPISCGKGICGACLTGVRSGVVDHRDQVLSEEEQARNDLFTPCCSRALSARLVLDL
ncbi:PDR/VanB family oxidoreductase [Pseudomonas typographi]|uniref:Oxidoreductase n=1 Tax=Pseudomonas typographi TaxID=2715964 RepID=A0ABR7Z8D0_9PSED|nr:PDR/VanB family oxidoreductase [Pseudomonas typographi]MBD1552037.1 oxidoreductase [Pseudomonas typographi]MBD1586600.1 oxidoreductase [Pseudomonas typographi]MBD1601752.1 oxidoreductase [Pseudomonas typographi]